MRSPIVILEQLANHFPIMKSYVVAEKGKAPYVLFPRHKVWYYAKSLRYRIREKNGDIISTRSPLLYLLEQYHEQEKKA